MLTHILTQMHGHIHIYICTHTHQKTRHMSSFSITNLKFLLCSNLIVTQISWAIRYTQKSVQQPVKIITHNCKRIPIDIATALTDSFHCPPLKISMWLHNNNFLHSFPNTSTSLVNFVISLCVKLINRILQNISICLHFLWLTSSVEYLEVEPGFVLLYGYWMFQWMNMSEII